MTPGEKMRKLRGKRPMRDVAKYLGVSLSSYVKYERDERIPRDFIKKRIAELYGVTVGSVFFD